MDSWRNIVPNLNLDETHVRIFIAFVSGITSQLYSLSLEDYQILSSIVANVMTGLSFLIMVILSIPKIIKLIYGKSDGKDKKNKVE